MAITLDGTNGITSSGVITGPDGSASAPAITNDGDTNTGIFFPAADTIAFGEGGAEAMRIDSSGNVGIGTSSPSGRLQIKDSAIFRAATDYVSNTYEAIYTETNTGGSGVYPFNANGHLVIQPRTSTGNARDIVFATGSNTPSTRAVITSGGNFLVGTTNDTGDGGGNEIKGDVENGGFITVKKTSSSVSGDKFMFFARNGTGVGSISLNGTSNVAYNTSSDYRLKENIAPLTSALVTIAQLKPCTWSWKSDGSNGQGFIAHELQAIVPDCVTGNKDAVDADGKPQYQGVDTSFLVATLTAAIQELKAELDTTKARLAALEAN